MQPQIRHTDNFHVHSDFNQTITPISSKHPAQSTDVPNPFMYRTRKGYIPFRYVSVHQRGGHSVHFGTFRYISVHASVHLPCTDVPNSVHFGTVRYFLIVTKLPFRYVSVQVHGNFVSYNLIWLCFRYSSVHASILQNHGFLSQCVQTFLKSA